MATVYPENYPATALEEQQHHRNTSSSDKQCILMIVTTILSSIAIICAIVIPLALNANYRKTVDPQLTSTSSMTGENQNSSEMNMTYTSIATTTRMTTTKLITTIRSSTKNTNTTGTHNYIGSTTAVHPWTNLNSVYHKETSSMKTNMASNSDAMNIASEIISMHSTLTTLPSYIKINYFNDTIYGVYNTIAGGPIGGFHTSSNNQIAKFAMDNLLETKYFNSKGNNSSDKGINTGFIVIPSTHEPTVACAFRFATGADRSDRDPLTFTLEGSNSTDIIQLNSSSIWTLLYNGSTGIYATEILNRSTYALQQNFQNEQAFITYRLLITSKRNNSDAVQYSEAEILGCP